jgi:hypothetical protein
VTSVGSRPTRVHARDTPSRIRERFARTACRERSLIREQNHTTVCSRTQWQQHSAGEAQREREVTAGRAVPPVREEAAVLACRADPRLSTPRMPSARRIARNVPAVEDTFGPDRSMTALAGDPAATGGRRRPRPRIGTVRSRPMATRTLPLGNRAAPRAIGRDPRIRRGRARTGRRAAPRGSR